MLSPLHRSLLRALAVSLLAHAVLLSAVFAPSRPALEPAASPLKARLVAPPAPPRAATARSPAAVSAPARTPSVAERPAPPPAIVAAASAPSTPPASAANVLPQVKAAPLPGTAPAPAIGTAAAPSAAAPGAERDAVSADQLREYRLALASAARRFKRYPALARQNGWEGTVEVALDFGALAPLPRVQLLRSSGRQALDAQALDMLSQAAAVAALPDGLKARDFRLVLAVQFSLDDDQ